MIDILQPQGAPAGAFSFHHNLGVDFMKSAIATLVLTVLSIFFRMWTANVRASIDSDRGWRIGSHFPFLDGYRNDVLIRHVCQMTFTL
ncbi:hypothetical protein PsgRace4_04391 [Pseudomonas savastanoi pv. glycinea str. race 4]|nr:hypothetical protein PsgRace4_04391 [Pseudomonas savastanoi pv. glycinea str. race 4]